MVKLYIILLIINIPFLVKAIKSDLFKKSPLFAIYFYSIFFLNIIGSSVVFFPFLSPYNSYNYFTTDFFYILLIQSISFWLFLPLHLRNNNFLKISFSNKSLTKMVRVVILFLALSFMLVALFVTTNGLPPFYSIDLSIGNTLLVEERSSFFDNVRNFWIFEIGFYTIPQISTVILFINYKLKKRKRSAILFYIVLLYSSLLSLSFLHKTPLVLLFFNIFLAQILFFSKKVSLVVIAKYVFLFFGLVAFGYYIALKGNSEVDLHFVSWGILNRVFGVYPMELAVAIKIVETHGLFYGTVMPNFFGLMPFEGVNLSRLIHYYIFQYEGSAPAPAIGYAYANFGYFGVVFHPLLVQVCIFAYSTFIRSINNKIFATALFSFVAVKVMFLSMTSVFDNLLNPRDVVVIIIIIIVYKLTCLRW